MKFLKAGGARRKFMAGFASAVVLSSLFVGSHSAFGAENEAVISVNQNKVGKDFDGSISGLSIEALNLANPHFATGELAQYMQTLGTGKILRIGGNKVDLSYWTSKNEPAPSWSQGTITPEGIGRLAELIERSDWKVVLGVNLKHFDPERAADQIKYAHQALGSSLLAVEIGNEPEFYYTDFNKFNQDFRTYVDAIRKVVPSAQFIGAEVVSGGVNSGLQKAFVEDQKTNKTVSALSRHFYPTSGCPGKSATISQLLGDGVYNSQRDLAKSFVAQADTLGAEAWISETNSAVCGGSQGVSDVFASALWALDYSMVGARQGLGSINFHSGTAKCDTGNPGPMYYTPFCAPTDGAVAEENLQARPAYYGLLASKYVGEGKFLEVTNPKIASIRAYAIRDGEKMTMVLINMQNPATNAAMPVKLNLGDTYNRANQLQLSSKDGLAAKTGITLGGATVQDNGKFRGARSTRIAVEGKELNVSIPAGSASIIKLSK